jgi:hypothetical protein
MEKDSSALERRVADLERRLRRRPLAVLAVAAVGLAAYQAATPKPSDVVRARRIVVVDEEGRDRIVLGQDPADTQRISRSVGLTLYGPMGAERGGFGVMDDGSVVLGLDAPVGVGHPMRDRIGLKVHPDGSTSISLIDNETRIPVRLVSEADGEGGVEFIGYDFSNRKATIKRIGIEGESREEVALDPPK